jgi:hypothetical protein
MYCSINGNRVDVYEDSGKLIRKFSFRGPVDSAYMSGSDTVVIAYSDVQNNFNPHPQYTELYNVDGRMIRRTRCR